MNYKELVMLIKDSAEDINETIDFYHGRSSSWMEKEVGSPVAWMLPSSMNATQANVFLTSTNYEVGIYFLYKDALDSNIEQELDLMEKAYDLCRSLVAKLNSMDSDEGNVFLISQINVSPVIKETSSCYTGGLLTLNVNAKDTYNHCDEC